ncbi:MAG: hypothetical protein EHM72_03320, partial [Calditrichaeota bacterium]
MVNERQHVSIKHRRNRMNRFERFICWALSSAFFVVVLYAKDTAKKELNEAYIWTSSQEPLTQLTAHDRRAFEPLDQPDENYPTIFIDPKKTIQTIEGFGCAFTDAASATFSKLPPARQEEFLIADFGEKGNGYNLCRTTIHSCDYSGEMYTYAEQKG